MAGAEAFIANLLPHEAMLHYAPGRGDGGRGRDPCVPAPSSPLFFSSSTASSPPSQGDVGFAVFRAVQTQCRAKLLGLAKRLREAPEEAALLKYIDDAGLLAAVEEYRDAVEEALPPPVLLQVEHSRRRKNDKTRRQLSSTAPLR